MSLYESIYKVLGKVCEGSLYQWKISFLFSKLPLWVYSGFKYLRIFHTNKIFSFRGVNSFLFDVYEVWENSLK